MLVRRSHFALRHAFNGERSIFLCLRLAIFALQRLSCRIDSAQIHLFVANSNRQQLPQWMHSIFTPTYTGHASELEETHLCGVLTSPIGSWFLYSSLWSLRENCDVRQKTRAPRVYAGRVISRHCHHWCYGGVIVASGASRPRSRSTDELQQ